MNSVLVKKVLLIEYEDPRIRAVDFRISNHGFEIAAAYSEEEVFEALDREQFDLILIDLITPPPDEKFRILRLLKEKGVKSHRVILSNFTDEESIKQAKDLGVREYLVKSHTPIIDVLDKIKVLLD